MTRLAMRPSAARTLVAWLPLAHGALVGCGEDGDRPGTGGSAGTSTSSAVSTSAASTTSGGDGGGPAASCGPVTGWPASDACTACSTTHCCDEVAACSTHPTCSGFAECIQPCGDDFACIDACAVLNWGDSPQDIDLLACQVEHCGEACGVAERRCDLAFAPPDAIDRDACHGCLESECCDENQAAVDPDVIAFFQCLFACEDPACLRACELAHPDALASADAAFACAGGTCRESCASELPGALCGAFGMGDAECASCARASCCDAQEACGFDTSCRSFLACWNGCFDDASCRSCFETWPAATAARAVAMEACASVACGDSCPGAPSCGLVKRLVPASCASCIEESCCDLFGACASDEACAARLLCSAVCDGDGACEAACDREHPEGATLHQPLAVCRDSSCVEVCP